MAKTCSKCGKEKNIAEFSKRSRSSDGRQVWCKDCMRQNASRWIKENPTKGYEYTKRYINTNRAAWNAWRKEDRTNWPLEKIKRTAMLLRRWRESNRTRVKQLSDRRHARIRGAFIEDVDKLTVWIRDKGICQIQLSDRCWYWLPANPSKWHLDHRLALANEGEHSYSNTQASCPPCNLEKHNRLVA